MIVSKKDFILSSKYKNNGCLTTL